MMWVVRNCNFDLPPHRYRVVDLPTLSFSRAAGLMGEGFQEVNEGHERKEGLSEEIGEMK